LLFLLWFSGIMAFWVGALLAQINGYPLKTALSLGAALILALGQYVLVWRLKWGRDLLGGLSLGFLPAYLGFYFQSHHWVSELFILGLMLSLASLNALLAHKWQQEWMVTAADGGTGQHPSAAARGLVVTLVNILLIGGLLLIWYFPATPLPGRGGAWVLAAAAVVNQEFIKRKYYASFRGSTVLAWMATVFLVSLSLWLLAVLYLRGQG
jgi:hypothetical protein